jgi:hypothetical protein
MPRAHKPKPESQITIAPEPARRGRGNPNWGKPLAGQPLPTPLSEFEKLAARLGLAEKDWPSSSKLHDFARRHAATRYVPEYLLKLWDLERAAEGYAGDAL